MRRRKAPLDFFSWHCYAYDPAWVGARARTFREMLDRHGFRKAESILNEWNYVKGWTGEWVYSLEVESGAAKLRKVSCRVTDAWHTYTDVPAEIGADGSILLSMEPCSFVLLEW